MRLVLAAAVGLFTLTGCHISVRDDYSERREACEVGCGDGSRAEAVCVKPKIPACSCEPQPTSSCVNLRTHSL